MYTYRVIPVHAELLNNGVLLEGVQSVQVAQANLPSKDWWGRLKNLFGSAEEPDENTVTSMTENHVSMFWTD